MNINDIERFFPLTKIVGEHQILRATKIIKDNNLLPEDTLVWEDARKNRAGRTDHEIELNQSQVMCRILEIDGELLDPKLKTSGHFRIDALIPLLDDEIIRLEERIKNDPVTIAWVNSQEFWNQ